jgi:hypothetical protein
MIDLLWLGVIAAVSVSLGRAMLAWLRFAPDDLPRQWMYGAALGLGVLGYGVFALTALHWLSFIAAVGLLILGAVIAAPMLIQSAREIVRGARTFRRTPIPPFARVGLALFALHSVVHLISCFNPPIDLDVLAYHLTVPKLNILHNEFVLRPDIVYANWPLHQELLFQLALLLHGDTLAQLISFFVATLAAGALWACARPCITPTVAALAAFIFYTIPVVGYEASIAYVDVGVALYAALAWFALNEWRATREDRWLALSAVMAGFAPATKLSGAFIPALLCIGVLAFAPQGKNRWKYSVGYGLIAGAVVAPWLIKTFLQTGNPVTPYLFDLIGARGWTHSAASQSTAMFAPFGMGRDVWAVILLPWNVTMYSTAFGGGNIGPIFLATLPILLLARPLPVPIKSALVLVLGYLVIWFWVVQEIRFLIPILPMLSLVAAYALDAWGRQNDWARRVAIGTILFAGFANLILLGTNFACPPGSVPPTKSLAVVFGFASRADYLRRVLTHQRLVETINQLPRSSLVLLLGIGEVYYIDRDYIRGFPIEQPLFDPFELPTVDVIAARVRELGVTHIVINYNQRDGRYYFDHPNAPADYVANLEEFARRDLMLIHQIDGYNLYVVRQ